ncbi:MAG: ADP-ribosylglycohydrolase family protein [Burkholderiales bacterium]|nr:ADP-ribosylglycohydrolase family protein [Burkholderiales bacterium]
MLGAIIGDIVGSVYEFDNIKTKDFPLFREDSRITDDTVCTVAVADSILNNRDPVETMVYWCRKHNSMGYGDRFVKWFDLPWQEPYGSFGNGAAMRVSPAAFLAPTIECARKLALRVTEITHNHPEGIKGALATSDAIWMAFNSAEPTEIRKHIETMYGYDLNRTVDLIRPTYKFNESCMGTVPEAIICALEAADFEDAIRNAISIGGDSDTLAAITGAIAEARFMIPDDICQEALRRMPDDLRMVILQMYRDASKHTGGFRMPLSAVAGSFAI